MPAVVCDLLLSAVTDIVNIYDDNVDKKTNTKTNRRYSVVVFIAKQVDRKLLFTL